MKEVISDKQGIIILILYILGSALVVGPGTEAGKDMWLAVITGLIMALPVVYVYFKIHCLFPGRDLYDILKLLFGKVLGSLISIIFIWFSIHLGAMVLFNFSIFIGTVALPQTPRIVPSACIMILCVYGVKLGIEVIGRWAEFFFYILIFIIFLIVVLSAMNFRFENIRPVLYNGITPVIKGAVTFFSFPLSETVVFTGIFSSLQNKNSYGRVYFTGVLLGTLILLLITVVNTLVLGPYIISLSYFPTYITVARISIGDFLQRLEILVSVGFLIAGFIKISMCMLSAARGISKLFDFCSYRFAVIPTGFLMLNFSFFVYNDVTEIQSFISNTYPYYILIINVIIPAIVFIMAKIKFRTNQNRQE